MPIKNPTKLLKKHSVRRNTRLPKKLRTEADLINAESELGRTIFGPIPTGHIREFFHHKKNVWIWHENGVTTRYEVRQHGVFKKAANGRYCQITGAELENFRAAAKTYLKLVKSHLYS